MTILQVWCLFLTSPLARTLDPTHLRPCDPFILSYVVYHHYRSLGWVPRSGVKFCVDWIVYRGADEDVSRIGAGVGPVGGHAEFSVVMIPTFEEEEEEGEEEEWRERKSWTWLSTVMRVTSGVKKVHLRYALFLFH